MDGTYRGSKVAREPRGKQPAGDMTLPRHKEEGCRGATTFLHCTNRHITTTLAYYDPIS